MVPVKILERVLWLNPLRLIPKVSPTTLKSFNIYKQVLIQIYPIVSFSVFCLVWNHHNNIPDNTRRMATDEPIPSSSSHSKPSSHYHHSQQGHYSHHQNWSNYNNPRRSGGHPNYSRGYNDGYWNGKGSRFASHRSVNSLMNNSNNYQQQSSQPSPPTQRRPNDPQQQYDNQTYYKSMHLSLRHALFFLLQKIVGRMVIILNIPLIRQVNNRLFHQLNPFLTI